MLCKCFDFVFLVWQFYTYCRSYLRSVTIVFSQPYRMYVFGGWVSINLKVKNKSVFLPEKEFKCTNSTACFNMGQFSFAAKYCS